MHQNGNEILAKGRSFSWRVDPSRCRLPPNDTDIEEKAHKITSVPFRASKVQGGSPLAPWCQISIHSQVSCFLDICDSPSVHWLVQVWSLYIFEIDIDINTGAASSIQQNRLTEAFLLHPLPVGRIHPHPTDFDLDVVTCFGHWNVIEDDMHPMKALWGALYVSTSSLTLSLSKAQQSPDTAGMGSEIRRDMEQSHSF